MNSNSQVAGIGGAALTTQGSPNMSAHMLSPDLTTNFGGMDGTNNPLKAYSNLPLDHVISS